MNKTTLTQFVIISHLAFLQPLLALAGVLLEYEVVDGPRSGDIYTIRVDESGLTLDLDRRQRGKPSIQAGATADYVPTRLGYRGETQKFWMLDPASESYIELPKQDLVDMAENRVRKRQFHIRRLRAKADALTEDQRKAMGPRYQELVTSLNESEAEIKDAETGGTMGFKNLGKSRKVGSWACAEYDLFEKHLKHSSLCLASLKEVGISQADFKLLKKFSSELEAFDPDRKASVAVQYHKLPEGITVESVSEPWVVNYGSKKVATQTVQLRKIEKLTARAASFRPPKSYKKVDTIEFIRQMTLKRIKDARQ